MSKKKETAPQGLSAAARFKAFMAAEVKPDIVNITAPSGFVYRFRRPGKFAMLFGGAGLPQAATGEALTKWQEADAMPASDIVDDQLTLVKAAFDLRDRVLELSYEPKLVMGEASGDNEVSCNDMPDADLEFLFKWVGAGGSVSGDLGPFLGRSKSNAMAGTGGS